MESTKLKNFMIILLLLLNLFFLLFVGYQDRQSRQYAASIREDTVKVLQNNGITVSETVVPWEDELSSWKVTRDRTREVELAEALLGEIETQDAGVSTVTVYEGERGRLQISRGGEFSLRLAQPEQVKETWPDRALSLLRGLDFQGQVIAMKELGEGRKQTVIWQVWEGRPVFNCQATAYLEDGTLTRLEGVRLPGRAEPDPAGEPRLEASTLLIRFLERIQEREVVCREIRSITTGYLYTAGLSTAATLTPAWYLETDTGRFILNCTTGELTEWSV